MAKSKDKDIFKGLDLTEKQQRLIMELHKPNTFEGEKKDKLFTEKAFENAGYCWNNNNTKKSIISRTLNNERIAEGRQRYIQFLMGNERNTLQLDIIEKYKLRAFYDISIFYDEDGTPKSLDDIPERYRKACLSSIENKMTGGSDPQRYTNFKLPDKDKALKSLTEVFNMFRETEAEISMQIKQKENASNVSGKKQLNQIRITVQS